jgi:hypothetical protein
MNFPTVSRGIADTAFIVIKNNEGAELIPGTVLKFTITTTDSEQGYLAEKVDVQHTLATAPTQGISAPLAGVVNSTISTGQVGRVQVRGPADVRVQGAITAGLFAVASSEAVAPTGVGTTQVQSTNQNVAYGRLGLGFVMENVSSTTARIQLDIM